MKYTFKIYGWKRANGICPKRIIVKAENYGKALNKVQKIIENQFGLYLDDITAIVKKVEN